MRLCPCLRSPILRAHLGPAPGIQAVLVSRLRASYYIGCWVCDSALLAVPFVTGFTPALMCLAARRLRLAVLAHMAFVGAQRALELQYADIAGALFRTCRCCIERA
jgi:hypothetical protein